jgi:hypothetical protein
MKTEISLNNLAAGIVRLGMKMKWMSWRTFLLALTVIAIGAEISIDRLGRPPELTTEQWIETMVSGERVTAADIRQLQQRATEALPWLIRDVSQRHIVVERAYAAFWNILPEWCQARLPDVLGSQQRRANAVALVGQLGPAAKPAVPYLADLLDDDVVDADAALDLGALGPAAREAVPALIQAVQEQRPFAATALGEIGSAARAAEPALEIAANSGPNWQRREALLALHRIRQDLATPATTRISAKKRSRA